MSPRSDLDTELRDLLDERLTAVVPPPADLSMAEIRGRRLRRRRALTAVAGAAAAVAVVAVGTTVVGGPEGSSRVDTAVEPLGPLDFSHGLRAYADPGHTLHLGGVSIDASGLEFLDTDAVATQLGVAYLAEGDLKLLREDGTTVTLDDADTTPEEFHPTAKADAAEPLIAYAVSDDGSVSLKVVDAASGAVVAARTLDCGACQGLVVDGVDSGAVFVRTAQGTSVWRYRDGDGARALAPFAGPDTAVADVRNGVVLYDGPAPDGSAAADWTLVAGAVDAQLTYDGRYVLSWSSRLRPTRPDDQAVVLDEGPVKGYAFWTIDTDGSVLVADPDPRGFVISDCLVPSGECEEVGLLDPQGGDPMFIGNDM